MSTASDADRRPSFQFLPEKANKAGRACKTFDSLFLRAPTLLAEADHMVSLNALRRPEHWGLLESKEIPEDLEGTTWGMLERVAAAARLAVEVSPGALDCGEAWRTERRRTQILEDGARLAEVLEHLLPGACTAILEPDRIRVIGREEGLQFWQAWWERER